ncbi:glycosyltransferase family 4 protein [Altererythrobacter sp. MTPC7]|uniref:glycosyltransferase family 4 protein n=1 Tax=Altererythrobacter sp. MTPC7 TaxID=3056567 RepID=UPI0036F3D347
MSALPPILILHNRYQLTGGEENVVAAERDLLAGAGHAATLREWSNDAITGLPAQWRAFRQVTSNPDAVRWLDTVLDETGAGLLHVHNFFPRLSPAIHLAATARGVAVVQTLHNYRLSCAAATFMREGAVCEKCLHSGSHWGVIHRCYRGSVAGSIASTRMQQATIGSPQWLGSVDRFITLSSFAKDKLVQAGLPPEKTAVKGNFLAAPEASRAGAGPRTGVLYVGRLSAEKGVRQLVDAWRGVPDLRLTLVGDGPLRRDLEERAPANVFFAGHTDAAGVARYMAGAKLLVMPSLWYEGFPLTIVEAFARGLPVIASDIGSLGEIGEGGRTARLVPPGDGPALVAAVRELEQDEAALGQLAENARAAFEKKHSASANLVQLEQIYEDALMARSTATGGRGERSSP